MAEPTRPIVRYHGGKWKLAPWIAGHFPAHRIYVEPFGGGGSVLFRKSRSYAEVYNDLDGEVVNLFRVARDRGDDLRRALDLTPYARAEFDLSFSPSDDPVEQARRTVVRSQMGFGGNLTRPNRDGTPQRTGFRAFTKDGRGSTPAGDFASYPGALSAIIDRLRGVVIEKQDACKVMLSHDGPTTLHYVDPPYVHSTRGFDAGGTHRGYRFEMDDEQHRQLARVLSGLAGAVIVSGYPCPLYDEELFADWTRVERRARADGARERTEVLWMRNVERDLFHEINHQTTEVSP